MAVPARIMERKRHAPRKVALAPVYVIVPSPPRPPDPRAAAKVLRWLAAPHQGFLLRLRCRIRSPIVSLVGRR